MIEYSSRCTTLQDDSESVLPSFSKPSAVFSDCDRQTCASTSTGPNKETEAQPGTMSGSTRSSKEPHVKWLGANSHCNTLTDTEIASGLQSVADSGTTQSARQTGATTSTIPSKEQGWRWLDVRSRSRCDRLTSTPQQVVGESPTNLAQEFMRFAMSWTGDDEWWRKFERNNLLQGDLMKRLCRQMNSHLQELRKCIINKSEIYEKSFGTSTSPLVAQWTP